MPQTLLDWLMTRYSTAKRETLRRMLSAGRVRVNGARPRSLKVELGPGDRVEVSERALVPVRTPPARLPFRIVHEDADLLVVDKPAGLLTSTVPGERRATLLAAVRAYVASRDPRARVGLIHRLDRDAAGLLVFSKSDEAYHSLKTQFFHHRVERTYLAVTRGVPKPGTGRVESRLEERADGTVYTTTSHAKGQRAVTHYEVVEAENRKALVRVRLETGRKHQIRVHLAEKGTPIVGDPVYGRPPGERKPATLDGLRLMAVRLAITHPRSGETVAWEIEPPAGFWAGS